MLDIAGRSPAPKIPTVPVRQVAKESQHKYQLLMTTVSYFH